MTSKKNNSRVTESTSKTPKVKSLRGFASMDPEKQRAIAAKGGKTVSKDHKHMASIGTKGGKVVSQNREHMAEIGKKGGKKSAISRARHD